MKRNVRGLDRLVRGVLSIWLLVVAHAAYQDDQHERAAITGIAGSGLLWNAVTCFCGGNYRSEPIRRRTRVRRTRV